MQLKITLTESTKVVIRPDRRRENPFKSNFQKSLLVVLLREVNFKTEFKFVFSSFLNAESRNAIMKHESENFEIKKI